MMFLMELSSPSQGAPSTIRCIKTRSCTRWGTSPPPCQGAPSTIRCIKTPAGVPVGIVAFTVREHPAPPGALRRDGARHARLVHHLELGSTQHH